MTIYAYVHQMRINEYSARILDEISSYFPICMSHGVKEARGE